MGARARCEAEAALGLRARAELARMVAAAARAAQPITLQRCERREDQPLAAWRCTDIYGRTLGRLFIAGEDAGESLIRAGLATRWPTRFDGCGFRR
jgi:endonuclease YncB( thermonuclease family)